MHIGLDRAGRLGLLVAGIAFILPAALIVMAIAVIYVSAGSSPVGAGILYLLKPVIIVVVAVAIGRIARMALEGPLRLAIGVSVLGLALLGVHELLLLAGGALLLAVARTRGKGLTRLARGAFALPAMATGAATGIGLPVLFLTFLKIGAVLYGSGYVLIAFLRADFVERLGWISDRQLLDGVAIGQITPGPLFTTATFVGYLVAGVPGAAVATVGIFLPAFVFVGLAGGLAARLRRHTLTAALLDGVNAAAVGLMAAVTLQLARDAIVDVPTAVLALAASALLLWRAWRRNSSHSVDAQMRIG
jgi:chromate transporter